MINLDDCRAVRLRAYELTFGETYIADDGRSVPVAVMDRLHMADAIVRFISTGELPKDDAE